MKQIYTFEDWQRDGSFKAQPGDFVDEAIVYEMRDCLPPVFWRGNILQPGEAYSHDRETGKQLYTTFVKHDEGWKYVGICPSGTTTDRTKFDYFYNIKSI